MPPEKRLFLTLNTFSSTGGIEKVCRAAGKALYQIMSEEGGSFQLYSLNDTATDLDARYIPSTHFRGFSGSKFRFIKAAVIAGRTSHTVFLSHVHLLLIGIAIKIVSPKTKIVLIAHGIEVWKPFPNWKVRLLNKTDLILAVSEFTKQKMLSLYGLNENKIAVLNNCLDPFLEKGKSKISSAAFKKKYGIGDHDTVLLTLARLQFSEQYKGYDKIIAALPELLKKYPSIRYLIAGKYDVAEKQRLDQIINSLNIEKQVVFTGFLPDEEVEACFEAAAIYVMPSTGEGFGIVFVEAMFYGKPVIAGNIDGSADALGQGRFGVLINPLQQKDVTAAIHSVLENKAAFTPREEEVLDRFGFPVYVSNLRTVLEQTLPASLFFLILLSFFA